MKLGIDKAAMTRARAAISYALTEAMDEGQCGLPTDELVPLAEKLLEVPVELVRTAMIGDAQAGRCSPCVCAAMRRADRSDRTGNQHR
jgi:exodeoxyribonuclease V alpha subunit